MRGLHWIYYWSAQFIIDYTFYVFNLLFVYLIVSDIVSITYMAVFVLSLILYSYCFSFLFDKSEKATKYFPLLNFLVGMCLPLINQLNDNFLKSTLLWLFKYLYPFYSLQSELVPIDLTSSPAYDITPFIVQIIFYSALLATI